MNSEITIRDAKPEDAPFLANTERTITQTPGYLVSRPHEIKDENFLSKINLLSSVENGKYIVAKLDGKIVGHGMLDPIPLENLAHVVHLTLAIHPDWQEQGIGKALLTNLIQWAQDSAVIEKIELQVRATNARARSLYQNIGFVEEGAWSKRIKISPNEYIDEVIMGLWIGSGKDAG